MALPDTRWRSEKALALSVLLGGLVITGASAFLMARETDSHANERFAQSANRVADKIQRRLRQSGVGLSGLRAFFGSTGQVNRKQFQEYVAALNLSADFPGVRGFGLIQRIEPKDLDQMVQAERADDAPGFAIRQLDNKDLGDLLVIRFIEPARWNQGAQGLDIGSERVRRTAAERAITTGEPTMTENIVLVQDNQRTAGTLLFVPLYRPGMPVTNALERRTALIGLLYSPIVVSELMQGIAAAEAGTIEFQLYDPRAPTLPNDEPFYASERTTISAATDSMARFERTQTLSLAQRDIGLRIVGTPRFEAEVNHYPSWAMLIAGSIISILLALLLRQQATGRRRAEELAQDMTRDLDRLATVVRSTWNSVSISGSDMRINWINEGFTRISGYSMHDALGKTPGELLGSGKADPLVLQTLSDAAAAGTGCRVEILNRAKNGSDYWIDTEVQPLHDAQGNLTGFMEIGSEITANKAIERELAHERRALANIIEGTNAGTWEWNAATGETRVNARWAAMIGYALAERDFNRIETWRTLIHPQDRRHSEDVIARHFRGELPAYECEIRVLHKDGHWVWVLGRGKLLSRTDDGMPKWMVGIHLDIDLRKKAEAALLENERLLRLVTENMGGRLAYFDRERRLRFANQATYDFFGGTAQSRIGCSFVEILGPKQMVYAGDAVDRVLAGEPQSYESETVLPDGQTITAIVHLVPDLQGSTVQGFVALAVDVTLAKREAMAMARQADTLLRTALEATGLGLVLFDAQERMVFCNDNYRELYGGAPELLVKGSRVEDIVRAAVAGGLVPEAVGRESQWVAERMALFRQASGEHSRQLIDGRSIRMVERRMPGGHFVGLQLDITDLVRATEAAQESARAKGQFLANMSHEIRTPMNAIMGLLALLRRTHLDNRQADYAVKTENAARIMLGLLNDILDYSKIESGKMALEHRPFALDEMLRELGVMLSIGVEDRQLEILFDIDPSVPAVVIGDKLRLQQVLINLGGNAVKFTEHGEVVLSVRALTRDDTTVTLEFAVRDTGIGIDARHHTSIFSVFSQAEGSITRRFGGTGLGLSISSTLVQLMGGSIQLDSSLGKGSRFSFTITLGRAVDAPQMGQRGQQGHASALLAAAPVAPEQRLPGLRILLVEDNTVNQQVMRELLNAEGAIVSIAAHGQAAIDILTDYASDFDLVLMDLQMPVMDGITATRHIRSDLGLTALPVIAMTANAMASDREACLEAGMNEHVGKPFELDNLVAVVRRHCGLSESASAAVGPTTRNWPVAVNVAAAESDIALQAAIQRLGGRSDVYLRMLRLFSQDLDRAPRELHNKHTAAADTEAIGMQLHTLRGQSATLGLVRLSAGLAEVEMLLQQQPRQVDNAIAVERAVSYLLAARPGVQALLEAMVGQTAPPAEAAAPALFVPHLQEALRLLADQLRESDMAATDTIQTLCQRYEGHAVGRDLRAAQDTIDRLDFSQALRQCDALMEAYAS
jgi:PAS domain S-box-containing protein